MDRGNFRTFRHELKTYLNHIVGYAELLLDVDEEELFSNELYLIQKECDVMIDKIDNSVSVVPDLDSVDIESVNKLREELISPLFTINGIVAHIKGKSDSFPDEEFGDDLNRILQSSSDMLNFLKEQELGAFKISRSNNEDDMSMEELNEVLQMPVDSGLISEVNGVTGKILVVDDNEPNRDVLTRHLARQGHTVVTAEDGLVALDILKEQSFDLVILDVMMPGLNGYKVLETMKASGSLRHIPVIMISAIGEISAAVRCIEKGAEDYLPKIFDPVLLRARIGACLSRKQFRDQEQMYLKAILASQRILAKELSEAADYVKSLLPPPIAEKDVKTDWIFIPSTQLGGDCFGYHWLDEDHMAIYLLDVSGHGIGAALLSVSVMNVLRAHSLPDTDFHEPGKVLDKLNQTFQMENQNNMYFTIWYGVYDKRSRRIKYASGGSPPAVLVTYTENDMPIAKTLSTHDMVIGIEPSYTYSTKSEEIRHEGNKLFLFSDGVFEVRLQSGKMMAIEQLMNILVKQPSDNDAAGVNAVLDEIREFAGMDHFEDDFSLLEVCFCNEKNSK